MRVSNAVIAESLAFFLQDSLASQLTLQDTNNQLKVLTGIVGFFNDESDWKQAINELTESKSEVEEHNVIEYGDFQTNESLARRVCDVLAADGCNPTIVVEPTCGQGNFVLAVLRRFSTVQVIYAVEIHKPYLYQCKFNILAHFIENPTALKPTIHLLHQSVFDTNFGDIIRDERSDELLIIGNPPWVTNATLGAMTSANLPLKTNFKHHSGLDAMTGKSNFDIAEFITIQLLAQFQKQRGHLALLIKNSVIKNIVYDQLNRPLRIGNLQKRVIDTKKEFNVSVEAALFSATLDTESAKICSESLLADSQAESAKFGWVNQKFVSNNSLYNRLAAFDGTCHYEWRQGIKHDCSAVMELTRTTDGYSTTIQSVIDVEDDLVYALYKSSDLQKPVVDAPRRFTFMTQQRVGADTGYIKGQYPKTYDYLNQYRSRFDDRKSSIYRGKPPYSIFGVGDYSFKPYKVAISGLYKEARFALVLPVDGKPAMLDDTCYFLGFDNLAESLFTLIVLNHQTTRHLLQVITFNDAKRVYTKDVLMRIDLTAIALSMTFSQVIDSCPDYLSDSIDPEKWRQYQEQGTFRRTQVEQQLSLF